MLSVSSKCENIFYSKIKEFGNDSIQLSKLKSVKFEDFIGRKFSFLLENEAVRSYVEYTFDGFDSPNLCCVELWYSDTISLVVYFNDIEFQDPKVSQNKWDFNLLKNERILGFKFFYGNNKYTTIFNSNHKNAINFNYNNFYINKTLIICDSCKLNRNYLDTNLIYISYAILNNRNKVKNDTIYFYSRYFGNGELFISKSYDKFPSLKDLCDTTNGIYGKYEIKGKKIKRYFLNTSQSEINSQNHGWMLKNRILFFNRKNKFKFYERITKQFDEIQIQYLLK